MYIKAEWDDSKYIRVGNMMLPTDASGYGNQTGEEISRQVKRDYDAEMARQEAEKRAAEERRLAEIKRQQDIARGQSNYELAFGNLDESKSPADQMDDIFNALVPRSGACDNLGAELVRAMTRIRYRDLNDGDLFYDGYGLETCGSSAAFLMDMLPEESNIPSRFQDIIENGYEDDSYTDRLEDIESTLLDYLKEHPELFGQDTEDSRDYTSSTLDEIESSAPRYEYEPYVDDFSEYIDNDCIDWSDIESWLDDLADGWGDGWGGEVHRSWGSCFTIEDLSKSQLRTWEEDYDDALRDKLDELEDEFPNFGKFVPSPEDILDYFDENYYNENSAVENIGEKFIDFIQNIEVMDLDESYEDEDSARRSLRRFFGEYGNPEPDSYSSIERLAYDIIETIINNH